MRLYIFLPLILLRLSILLTFAPFPLAIQLQSTPESTHFRLSKIPALILACGDMLCIELWIDVLTSYLHPFQMESC